MTLSLRVAHRLTRPTRDLMKVRGGTPHAHLVMAGFVPAIYPKLIGWPPLRACVDGRDKPGHDGYFLVSCPPAGGGRPSLNETGGTAVMGQYIASADGEVGFSLVWESPVELDAAIVEIDRQVDALIGGMEQAGRFRLLIALLCKIPGVSKLAAMSILAEARHRHELVVPRRT